MMAGLDVTIEDELALLKGQSMTYKPVIYAANVADDLAWMTGRINEIVAK